MRKSWQKLIHGKRRPTKPYDAAEVKYILAEREKQPPTSWERIGRALDRHPMSIQDKWYRLEKMQQEADREPPPISAKAGWPVSAWFRPMAMKPTFAEPRFVPHGCPRFAREMMLYVTPRPSLLQAAIPPASARQTAGGFALPALSSSQAHPSSAGNPRPAGPGAPPAHLPAAGGAANREVQP